MSGPSPPGNLLAMPPASPEPGQPGDHDGPDSPPLSSSRALRNVARQFVGAYYRDLNVAPSRVERYYTVRLRPGPVPRDPFAVSPHTPSFFNFTTPSTPRPPPPSAR